MVGGLLPFWDGKILGANWNLVYPHDTSQEMAGVTMGMGNNTGMLGMLVQYLAPIWVFP